VTGHPHGTLRRPHLDDVHLVAGEGARLVRADEGRRAQGLDGLEAAHECVPAGHELGRPGEREGDRRQQPLRHECDRHTDREEEAEARLDAEQQGDAERDHTGGDGHDGDDGDDAVQLDRQGARRPTCGPRQGGDLGQPRAPSGGDDSAASHPLHDEGPGSQDRPDDRPGRHALPRQHGLVDGDRHRRVEAQVGADAVTRL
jgi:hypothetical protein